MDKHARFEFGVIASIGLGALAVLIAIDPLRIEIARLTAEVERLRAERDKENRRVGHYYDGWDKAVKCAARADIAKAEMMMERDKLRAERAEVLALLDATDGYQLTDYCDGAADEDDASDECFDETPCWAHRAYALVAKLRGDGHE